MASLNESARDEQLKIETHKSAVTCLAVHPLVRSRRAAVFSRLFAVFVRCVDRSLGRGRCMHVYECAHAMLCVYVCVYACRALQATRLLSGDTDFVVQLHSLPDGALEKVLCRMTAVIADVAFSPDGSFVAVAAVYARAATLGGAVVPVGSLSR